MADHDHVNKLLFLLPCLFLLISVIDSHRHGSSGNSLHIPKQKFGDQIGERTIIIEADLDSLPQVKNENSYERVRRSVAKHTLAAKFSTVVCTVQTQYLYCLIPVLFQLCDFHGY